MLPGKPLRFIDNLIIDPIKGCTVRVKGLTIHRHTSRGLKQQRFTMYLTAEPILKFGNDPLTLFIASHHIIEIYYIRISIRAGIAYAGNQQGARYDGENEARTEHIFPGVKSYVNQRSAKKSEWL